MASSMARTLLTTVEAVSPASCGSYSAWASLGRLTTSPSIYEEEMLSARRRRRDSASMLETCGAVSRERTAVSARTMSSTT
jgi:hypothetical protein